MLEAYASRDRVGLQPFFTVMWVMMRAKLADVYRKLERTDAAAGIDRELQRMLAKADPDLRPLGGHPVVR